MAQAGPYTGDMEGPGANARWFESARRRIPGGVHSPVRAWRAVGGDPVVHARAAGSSVWDLEGRRYVDFVGSWGALLLGHADPQVVRAVQEAATRGTSYGAPHPTELDLAEEVCRRFPSIEQIRLTSTGTEAAMGAIRLARAATGRDRIVLFEGGYHGHSDACLVAAGSGMATLGIPGSPGVPTGVAGLTTVLPYNDAGRAEAFLRAHGGEVAALLVEPVAGNMGVIPPREGFLETLRRATTACGALLVFDEVITGFRVAPGGAQERFGIRPDLTLLGKILGGGMPVGGFGGRTALLSRLAPEGPVYHAGTLSGNPVGIAAGLATLRQATPDLYARLDASAARLADGLQEEARRAGVPCVVQRVASMLTLFLTRAQAIHNLAEAKTSSPSRFRAFFHTMRRAGFLLPPSPYEAWFVSAAHTAQEIDAAVAASGAAFREVAAVQSD